jgi:HlyD family secretion protein
MKTLVTVIILVAMLGGTAAWYWTRNGDKAVTYRTATVKRQDVVSTIGATGTVEPEELIDVGAQVAGQILTFGKDVNDKTVDYGSIIEANSILATIDDSVYTAALNEANAQNAQAKANVARADADLLQLKAKLEQAERDWERAQKLGPSDALAQAAYDAYKSTYAQAKAQIAIGDAAIAEAKASVEQSEASIFRAKRNLGYTVIKSPVKGVIIDRRVNIGQTVVASLNAPSLFLIATDLKRMQVWVAVNEADIGNIRAGQPVTFTVDSFPGEVFRGEVNKVRLNAAMTQNVVTYTVEVMTDNSSGRLLPYLTANVQFEVARREGVLSVPNAALRYTPQPEQIAAEFREKSDPQGPQGSGTPASASDGSERRRRPEGGSGGGGGGGGDRGGRRRSTSGPTSGPSFRPPGEDWRPETIWVKDGAFVKPIKVRAGISDGIVTQVVGDGVNEGLEVVVGEIRPDAPTAASAGSGGTNPFAPPMRGGRGGGGGGGRRGGGF